MQPLAACGFAKTLKPQRTQPVFHRARGVHDLGKTDIRRGIEIEHQPPRHFGRIRRAIPRMQFEPTDLRDGG